MNTAPLMVRPVLFNNGAGACLSTQNPSSPAERHFSDIGKENLLKWNDFTT